MVLTLCPRRPVHKDVRFHLMSRNGQVPEAVLCVTTLPMRPGARFSWHAHDSHQLAWADHGVLTVRARSGTWVLPPTRALWIPAGTEHETSATGETGMKGIYLESADRESRWSVPQPLAVTPLMAELVEYLSDGGLGSGSRARAEALLLDLLEPIEVVTIELAMPADPRAVDVADGLIAQPADPRSLAAWGREVGASARTLSRAFLADTGIPFNRWRTGVRMRAALPHLACGVPVSQVAGLVGYETASAFVAAFRRETGTTPAAYFQPLGGVIHAVRTNTMVQNE
jgi:AraC-like DNA-binding protein/quercetin dioxygenase-like cupin family protein